MARFVVRRIALAIAVLAVVLLARPSSASLLSRGDKIDQVTCGSAITLKGHKVGTNLACKEVAYGGHGSGQMACTGVMTAEPERYFIIKGTKEEECPQGSPIPKNAKIRLQNVHSGRWLHSHKFRSMLSNNQEVSCFGSSDESDDSDVWKITWSGGGKYLAGQDKFMLQHEVTKMYLVALDGTYPQPLTGQKEVAGVRSKIKETLFLAEDGIYFPQRKPGTQKTTTEKTEAASKDKAEL